MAKEKTTKKQILDKKLREYKKILQKDADWDWIYILRLLKYKLERTRKCILSNDIVVSAPKIAKQIQAVETLLERVEKDQYFDEISKDFHQKYGKLRMVTKKVKGKPYHAVKCNFTKETETNSKEIHKEFSKLRRRAEFMQRNDIKKAFALMHKNIWGWWD